MTAENRLIQDDDGHWYVIPAGDADEFYCWCNFMANGGKQSGKDFQQYIVKGPHCVVFGHWEER